MMTSFDIDISNEEIVTRIRCNQDSEVQLLVGKLNTEDK